MVVNNKKLNDICQHNSVPLPYTDEISTDLRDCAFFSRCDMESGFQQVPMAEESKHLPNCEEGYRIFTNYNNFCFR